jgi:hypothetical protein
VSVLEVSAWNDEEGQEDELIGSTKIDLLDRIHSRDWENLGKDYRVDIEEDDDLAQLQLGGGFNYDLIDEMSQTLLAKAKKERGEGGGPPPSSRCPTCDAKFSEDLQCYQCYCGHIEWIQKVHQRLEPKPVELRSLNVATSHLPRGSLRLWVDIMTQAEAKQFQPAYFLKSNFVKTLFMKLVNGKKYKEFSEQDVIAAIDDLSPINRAGVFFGKKSGNSILRQCIK